MMTKQNPTIDGRTRRAADLALAKRTISRASYDAILAGTLTLEEAKELGRDGAPATDTGPGRSGPGTTTGIPGRASAEDRRGGADQAQKLCLCGCGELVARTFKAGHDSRLLSELRGQIRKGDVLLRSERITDQQREFAVRHGLIGEEALPPETGEED
jgi:hypothetical protein